MQLNGRAPPLTVEVTGSTPAILAQLAGVSHTSSGVLLCGTHSARSACTMEPPWKPSVRSGCDSTSGGLGRSCSTQSSSTVRPSTLTRTLITSTTVATR